MTKIGHSAPLILAHAGSVAYSRNDGRRLLPWSLDFQIKYTNMRIYKKYTNLEVQIVVLLRETLQHIEEGVDEQAGAETDAFVRLEGFDGGPGRVSRS